MGCADGRSQSGALFDLKGAYLCSENVRNDGEQALILGASSSDQDTLGLGLIQPECKYMAMT